MITHNSIGYSGRLGNQMFQYATLKSISIETGFSCVLPNNTKIKSDGAYDFTNNKWIPYKLDLLNCFEISSPILDIKTENKYQEKNFIFEPEIFDIKDNTSIEGYFQSYKYFEKYKEQIYDEFKFKNSILYKCFCIISKYSDTVAIHVRRGDYVNHSGFWNITEEYIQEAINKFNDKKYTFLVFSDDIKWCKQIFPENMVYVENNNHYEDLCLMSLCNHNIISNSSYSWWGAYLNKNEDKKIIAPKNWFTESKPLIDLYPKNWIIV